MLVSAFELTRHEQRDSQGEEIRVSGETVHVHRHVVPEEVFDPVVDEGVEVHAPRASGTRCSWNRKSPRKPPGEKPTRHEVLSRAHHEGLGVLHGQCLKPAIIGGVD